MAHIYRKPEVNCFGEKEGDLFIAENLPPPPERENTLNMKMSKDLFLYIVIT